MKTLSVCFVVILSACGTKEWSDAMEVLGSQSGESTQETEASKENSISDRIRLDPRGCRAVESESVEIDGVFQSTILADCDGENRLFREINGEFASFSDCRDVRSFDMYEVQSEIVVAYDCGGSIRFSGKDFGTGENPQIASNGSETIVGAGNRAWVDEILVNFEGEIQDIRHQGENFEVITFDAFHSYQMVEVSPEGWVLSSEQIANHDEHPIFVKNEGIALYSPYSYGVTINEDRFDAPVGTRLIEATLTAIVYQTKDTLVLHRGSTMSLGKGPIHLNETSTGRLIVNQGGIRILLD